MAVFLVGVVDSEAAEPVACDRVLDIGADGRVDDFETEGFGEEGSGHVMSAARVDLQCILILLYKYHWEICRSEIDTPGFSKLISTASVSENRCARTVSFQVCQTRFGNSGRT